MKGHGGMNKLLAISTAAASTVATLGVASLLAASDVRAQAPAAQAPAAADSSKPTLVPLDIFTVPKDLEVTLWARSPMLKNPTNIDIDARGRIWVTEGVNYRRHATRDPKGDRVVILEDTDKERRADQSTVLVQ